MNTRRRAACQVLKYTNGLRLQRPYSPSLWRLRVLLQMWLEVKEVDLRSPIAAGQPAHQDCGERAPGSIQVGKVYAHPLGGESGKLSGGLWP
jgi:hypothetical protein